MAEFPAEFLSLEADFVDCKMSINNNINTMLREERSAVSKASQIGQAQVVEAQRCVGSCTIHLQQGTVLSRLIIGGFVLLAAMPLMRQIKLMTVEVRGRQPMLRKAMQTKVNLYREELQGLIRDIERAQLMAKEGSAVSSKNSQASHYERLTKSTDRLTQSSMKLEDTHRIVAETEEVGIAVLDTLASQRERLLESHDKVRETGAMLTEARRLLQRMTRRILTNTIVLYTTIFILGVAICYVLYADFIRTSRRF
ncbi:hypothetical protein CCR75_006426 [Bremia lactucae]|uniref:Vesicle transport v-SNARE N-terminal domain-containing protein n=1 Tax=Bremia lactucae TaxID=4779 RepID=A0A976FK91_BRELC|nr:hypothetical protein CCR75_006426 [Bremia lactucae]